jgi:hypothetical protein
MYIMYIVYVVTFPFVFLFYLCPYKHTHIHTYIHMCVCVCVCVYVYVYVYVCMYVCMYVYIHTHIINIVTVPFVFVLYLFRRGLHLLKNTKMRKVTIYVVLYVHTFIYKTEVRAIGAQRRC